MSLPPGWRPQPPEVKPGVIPLRPLSIGEILSAVFVTIREHWRPLVAVCASVAAVAVLLLLPAALAAKPLIRAYTTLITVNANESYTSAELNNAASAVWHALWGFMPWLLLIIAVQFTAAVVIDTGSALVVSRAVLGRSTTASDTLTSIGRGLPKLIGLGLLIGISVTVGLFLCIIPGLVLATFWFAAPMAMKLEPSSITGSLRRSSTLVSRSFWRVLGILILVQIIVGVAVQVVSAPLSIFGSVGLFAAQTNGQPSDTDVTAMLLVTALSGVLTLLLYAFASVARALLYLDLRMRQENLAPALVEASSDR